MSAETNSVVAFASPQLPEPVARRGINEAQWRTLVNNLYPGAASESVLMVWDYCKARKLDPLKKPCHIVPMRVKDSKSGDYVWRDVVMPGIYEYRTTATRTGLYLGHSKPEYGQTIEYLGHAVPEFCELTVYRWSKEANQRIEFPVRVLFCESAATKREQSGKDKILVLNERWSKAPVQMLTKCAEAAGLREAFPDELGGEATFEEMAGREIDVTPNFSAHPSDGLPPADPTEVDRYVAQITDILAQDVEEQKHANQVFAIHLQICTDASLYTEVQNVLKKRKILSAAGLKALIEMGSKAYQSREILPNGKEA